MLRKENLDSKWPKWKHSKQSFCLVSTKKLLESTRRSESELGELKFVILILIRCSCILRTSIDR